MGNNLKRTAALGGLTCLTASLFPPPAWAGVPTDAGADTTVTATTLPVEDTTSFFHAFVSRNLSTDRDPFAVKAEADRLPTTWDPKRILYFPLMPDAQSTSVVPSDGGAFYYRLWTQGFTAFGGWKADRADGGWHPRNALPLQIRRGIEGLGQHDAPLGFGTPVTVVDYSAVDYVLALHGTETCPPNVFDRGNCRYARPDAGGKP